MRRTWLAGSAEADCIIECGGRLRVRSKANFPKVCPAVFQKGVYEFSPYMSAPPLAPDL